MNHPCKVKLCGTSSVEDARLAEEVGADYIGVLVEVDFSERSQSVSEARTIAASVFTPVLLLTFDRSPDWIERVAGRSDAFGVQLLGHETPETLADVKRRIEGEVWKSIFLPPVGETEREAPNVETLTELMRRYADAGADKLLLDTEATVAGKHRFGGTGRTSDWEIARRLIEAAPVPTFLSGGLHAGNVAEACRRVRPYGLDLCSGVESSRGKRDPARTAALMRALRAVESST